MHEKIKNYLIKNFGFNRNYTYLRCKLTENINRFFSTDEEREDLLKATFSDSNIRELSESDKQLLMNVLEDLIESIR